MSNDFNETNNQMHLKIVKTSGRCHLFHMQAKHRCSQYNNLDHIFLTFKNAFLIFWNKKYTHPQFWNQYQVILNWLLYIVLRKQKSNIGFLDGCTLKHTTVRILGSAAFGILHCWQQNCKWQSSLKHSSAWQQKVLPSTACFFSIS